MNERNFDPITGQPITDNQQTTSPNAQQPVGQTNLNKQPANPFSQPAQKPANNQNGQPFGQPMNNQNGQPFGQPNNNRNGQPFGQPMNNQNGQPFGQPGNNQFGQPYGQPGNNQFGQPYGQPGNNQFGQPYGQNQYGAFPGQAPKKGLSTAQIIIIAAISVVLIALIAVLVVMSGSRNKNVEPDIPDPIVEDDPTIAASEEASVEDEEEPEKEEPEEDPAPAPAGEASISNFSINGKQYTLPVSINEFLDNGWTYNDPKDALEIVNAKSTEIVRLNFSGKGDSYVLFSVINHSIDAQPVSECMICDASFSDSFVKRTGAEVKMYNDQFQLQVTTTEEVKAALGEPSRSSTDDNSVSFTYRGEGEEAEYKLYTVYRFDNNILTSVDINNRITPSDFEQPEVNTATPDYLSKYEEPSELGDKLLSGNVSIAGKVYNLPVPLSVLKDNGWTYDQISEPLPSMHATIMTVKKGDSRLTVEVLNPLPNAINLDNTIVTSISTYYSKYNNVDVVFPGDIKPGMKKADLDKVLKAKGITNFTYDEKYKVYKINYNSGDKSDYPKEKIEIRLDDEDDTVYSIDADRYGWLLK